MNKTLITGTGRCGTTFLIQLLTNLGFNTGYTREECENEFERIDNLRGGIEHGLGTPRIEKADYIKNPNFLQVSEFEKLRKEYNIDLVILPIRGLESSAKSREYMSKTTHAGYGGFCWNAKNVYEQKIANARMVYAFIHHCALENIPIITIGFERMMNDPIYLWDRLSLDIDNLIFFREYKDLINLDYVRF